MNHYAKVRKRILMVIRGKRYHHKMVGITDYYSSYTDWLTDTPKTQISLYPQWAPLSKKSRKKLRAGLLKSPIYPNIMEAENITLDLSYTQEPLITFANLSDINPLGKPSTLKE